MALRQRFAHLKQRQRSVMLEEWHLVGCRAEAQQVVRQLRLQEQRLQDGLRKKAVSEAHVEDMRLRIIQNQQELQAEQELIRDLNRQATELRGACYLPARLKRESGFLLKMLDQGGGGRAKTRKHLRSLDTCLQLYDRVSEVAPNLLPLMSRAR